MALEDVVKILQHKGNTEEALSLGCTGDGICMCKSASTIQTTLESYLVDIGLLIIHLEFKLS